MLTVGLVTKNCQLPSRYIIIECCKKMLLSKLLVVSNDRNTNTNNVDSF